MTKIVSLIGAALILVGLVVGFVPVSSGGVGCGSAFVASDDAAVSDLGSTLGGFGPVTDHQGDCDSLRSILRVPAFALIAVGLLTLAGAQFLPSQKPGAPNTAGSGG